MSLNPSSEVRYRHRLASDHLKRAERLFQIGDWAGTVSASQLAVENFAKAVIGAFEVPTWGHDPSSQLSGLIESLPSNTKTMAKQLASMSLEAAPEHGRSSYGEPSSGLVPSDVYNEGHATNALSNARKAKETAEKILTRLDTHL